MRWNLSAPIRGRARPVASTENDRATGFDGRPSGSLHDIGRPTCEHRADRLCRRLVLSNGSDAARRPPTCRHSRPRQPVRQRPFLESQSPRPTNLGNRLPQCRVPRLTLVSPNLPGHHRHRTTDKPDAYTSAGCARCTTARGVNEAGRGSLSLGRKPPFVGGGSGCVVSRPSFGGLSKGRLVA